MIDGGHDSGGGGRTSFPRTEGAFFPTIDEINAAKEVIVGGWEEVVG